MIGDGATTSTPALTPLKIDVSQFTLDGPSLSARTSPRLAAQDPGSSKRSATRRVFGAIVGGTAGFFAGGYTGAWIEGDRCQCDDPGLKGALIGAPIGAAVGAILGALYLF